MSDNLYKHVRKCRFCFKWMKEKVKITQETKQMFFDLTNLWLRSGEQYSKYVCDVCERKLQRFSRYQKLMIEHQEILNEHEDLKAMSSNRLVGILGIDDIKIEVEDLFEAIECSDQEQEENDEPLAVVETSYGTPPVTEVDESVEESNIPVEDVSQCDVSSEQERRHENEEPEERIQAKQKTSRSRRKCCPECSANVKIKFYQAHMDQHKLDQEEAFKESDDILKCDYHYCDCGEIFKSLRKLAIHRPYCHKKPPTPTTTCKVCQKSFKGRLRLVKHINSFHKPEVMHEVRRSKGVLEIAWKKKFKCLSCLERFSCSEGLSLHSKTCRVFNKPKSKTLNICLVPDCDFSTYQNMTMVKHITAHTDIDLRLKNDMLQRLGR